MDGEPPSSNSPIPVDKLTTIATAACEEALGNVKGYEHEQVNQWSKEIINKILKSLIDATSSSSTKTESDASSPTTQYRFNVTCTIIQQGHASPEDSEESTGRRGMHTCSGAYWDVQRDGMWTFKYSEAEQKGMDLVLNVVWFGSR